MLVMSDYKVTSSSKTIKGELIQVEVAGRPTLGIVASVQDGTITLATLSGHEDHAFSIASVQPGQEFPSYGTHWILDLTSPADAGRQDRTTIERAGVVSRSTSGDVLTLRATEAPKRFFHLNLALPTDKANHLAVVFTDWRIWRDLDHRRSGVNPLVHFKA
jgi:hypothetical protein